MTDVGEDSDLSPAEKGVTIRFSRADDRVTIHSEIASITRALLSREDFEERERRTADDQTVAVTGTLPVGALKIKERARTSGSWAQVVSGHD